jgi:cyclase
MESALTEPGLFRAAGAGAQLARDHRFGGGEDHLFMNGAAGTQVDAERNHARTIENSTAFAIRTSEDSREPILKNRAKFVYNGGAAFASKRQCKRAWGIRLLKFGLTRRGEMETRKSGERILRCMLGLLAAAALGNTLRAQNPDFSKVEIKVTKVSGNIYMLEGEGGNIAASVGEDGIVIVDDQFAPLADKIQAALKNLKITDKPVRFVINTHYHGDHTGGNLPFANAGSTLIAQDNVRKRLESGGVAGNGGSLKIEAKPAAKAALPVITFDHDVTVHLNGEDIRALHFPAGHTDGDAIIFFPKNNVVHMGDDFVRYGFPFIDVAAGGSVQGMISAVEKALTMLPPDVKVIPGHGALSNLDDVRAFVKMLKETSAVVQQAIDRHQTLEQMKQAKILAPWERFSGSFINTDAFIETLYNSLTGQKGPFMKHN